MEIDLQWEEQTSEMEKRWVNQCVYWWLCVFEIIDRKMQNIYIFLIVCYFGVLYSLIRCVHTLD